MDAIVWWVTRRNREDRETKSPKPNSNCKGLCATREVTFPRNGSARKARGWLAWNRAVSRTFLPYLRILPKQQLQSKKSRGSGSAFETNVLPQSRRRYLTRESSKQGRSDQIRRPRKPSPASLTKRRNSRTKNDNTYQQA